MISTPPNGPPWDTAATIADVPPPTTSTRSRRTVIPDADQPVRRSARTAVSTTTISTRSPPPAPTASGSGLPKLDRGIGVLAAIVGR